MPNFKLNPATLVTRLGARTPHIASDRLCDLDPFGSNPGALRARYYRPESAQAGAPLVVVLHGCTQSAAVYDQGSGWSELADTHGFVLLFPEQTRANNANMCFNWFTPGDTRRDVGEALSIRQMVAAMIAAHDLDATRVFVTGLSAGGAMTAVMLATYPDVFAGGAVIAGLHYGSAQSMPAAFEAMRGGPASGGNVLADRVRAASSHAGPWPTLSVWHGDADRTVDVVNAEHLIAQWRGLNNLPERPNVDELIDTARRRAWTDASGRVIVEDYRIVGMGHGTPLAVGSEGGGRKMPFMLDVGIASTRHIAASWGLLGEGTFAPAAPIVREAERTPATPAFTLAEPPKHCVAKIIDDALRSAGLLR